MRIRLNGSGKTLGTLSRWLLAVTAVAGVTAGMGCGNVTDPDPVKQDELKRASDLRILDKGNGAIQLSWEGTNNEAAFEGYNIFGMKGTDAALGTTEGSSIELLGSDGNVDATAKAILQKFNYNPADPFNTVGDKVDADKAISYLPAYEKDGDKPILPTCRPVSNGTCEKVTTANKGKTSALNGRTTFDITGLKIGERYCFFIMSSMKEGKKVSASSTEVVCTYPKYKLSAQLKTLSGSKSIGINLDNIRATCASSSCPDLSTFPSATTTNIDLSDAPVTTLNTSTKTRPFYLERFSNAYYLTAGANAGIIDMGYYADGFSDSRLPDVTNTFDNDTYSATTTTENGTGYSLLAQSVRVEAGKHIYVVAMRDPSSTNSSAKADIFYHWIYISDDTLTADTAFTAELRLSKVSGIITN